MVTELDDKALRNFAIAFSPFETNIREIQPIGEKRDFHKELEEQADINNIIKRAKDNPKLHIWLGAHNLLISILDMHGYSDYLQFRKHKNIRRR